MNYIIQINLEHKESIMREISISSNNNLEELHYKIIDIFKLDKNEIGSFYTTNSELETIQEISLININFTGILIFFISSDLNPFITDITIIKTATPRLIPIKENIVITFKKPSFFLVFKYLNVISFSKFEINFLFLNLLS